MEIEKGLLLQTRSDEAVHACVGTHPGGGFELRVGAIRNRARSSHSAGGSVAIDAPAHPVQPVLALP